MMPLKRFTLGDRLRKLFALSGIQEKFYQEMQDLLVEADVGGLLAGTIVDELKKSVKAKCLANEKEITTELKNLLGSKLSAVEIKPVKDKLNVILVCGVNGVGKTTTIGKLAFRFNHHLHMENIVLCAADTFRAAAIEQLVLLGGRLGLKVIHQSQGADPGAVVFDAIESAKLKKTELVIIDTSGRMHTKEHLVKELAKINKIVSGKIDLGGLYHKMLVIDATTGQNALRQAEVFHQALAIDSIVIAKYDSSAKGGVAVAIGRELSIPFSFVGSGEKFEQLAPFRVEEYVDSLFDTA